MRTKGRERTLGEWETLFTDTGFGIEHVLDMRTFAKYLVVRLQR